MIRVGVAGTGAWGQNIARVLHNSNNVDVTALASKRAREVTPYPNAEVYETVEELIEKHAVDALVLANPAKDHAQCLQLAIEERIPVFVEKPLTLNLSDAIQLEELWKSRHKPVVLCDHVQLWNKYFEKAVSLASQGGGVVSVNGAAHNWGPFRDDCSGVWDYGSHLLAMALWATSETDEGSVHITAVSGSDATPHPSGHGFIDTALASFDIGPRVRASLLMGNSLSVKAMQMSLEVSNGAWVEFNDCVPEKLKLNGRPIQLQGVGSPLTNALAAFFTAVKDPDLARMDDRFGLRLSVEVIRGLTMVDTALSRHGYERRQMNPPSLK